MLIYVHVICYALFYDSDYDQACQRTNDDAHFNYDSTHNNNNYVFSPHLVIILSFI